jgi:hypothetical protein
LPDSLRICEKRATMADHRISDIALDETTIVHRNAEIERERAVAIADLTKTASACCAQKNWVMTAPIACAWPCPTGG